MAAHYVAHLLPNYALSVINPEWKTDYNQCGTRVKREVGNEHAQRSQ
jgi:hypothetical protein